MARTPLIAILCAGTLAAVAGEARAAALICAAESLSSSSPSCEGEAAALSCEAAVQVASPPVAVMFAAPAGPEVPLACELGIAGVHCQVRLPAQAPVGFSLASLQARWAARAQRPPRPHAGEATLVFATATQTVGPGYARGVFRPPQW